MMKQAQIISAFTILILPCSAANALEMTCIHPDLPNNSYRVDGDRGVYTWDDHEIERSWALKCTEQRDGSATCHRSESFGERGNSVSIFRMLPGGSLVESGYWALLNTSRVSVTPGFVCNTEGK